MQRYAYDRRVCVCVITYISIVTQHNTIEQRQHCISRMTFFNGPRRVNFCGAVYIQQARKHSTYRFSSVDQKTVYNITMLSLYIFVMMY